MRSIQDRNFLVWEVYSSGGRHGFSDRPQVIFHCLTQQDVRPRHTSLGTDEADAQRLLAGMSDAELLALLDGSAEIA